MSRDAAQKSRDQGDITKKFGTYFKMLLSIMPIQIAKIPYELSCISYEIKMEPCMLVFDFKNIGQKSLYSFTIFTEKKTDVVVRKF